MAPPGIRTILFTANQIRDRVGELACEIDKDHRPDEPVQVVAVLKGSFVFVADLIRAMRTPLTLDFIAIASNSAGTTSPGEIQLLKDLDSKIEGRPVLIVEDIVDTGHTLHYLHNILGARAPKSLRTACLLTKPSRRAVTAPIDYAGFEIEDRFVVGYGLDYREQFRQLPYIGILDELTEPLR